MDIKPSDEALVHSRQLSNLIDLEVEKLGGKMSFSHYMNLALYAPSLGYYAAGANKLGAAGDFVTAPELSPWFGATIVQTILPVLKHLSDSNLPSKILEFGAGSGALAKSILEQLSKEGVELDEYLILEVSPDLKDRQQEKLHQIIRELGISTKIIWLDTLPEQFDGVILANEVIDAFPIDLIVKREGGWHYVCIEKNQEISIAEHTPRWAFTDGPMVNLKDLPTHLQEHSESLPLGYQTEIHIQAQAWIKSLAQSLRNGIFLTFDYGFPASEYYHPQRNSGTVMAHYRHHAIPDPFLYPGLADITAHVEWTTLTETAIANSLKLIGYQSQAGYLLNAGIGDLLLANLDPRNPNDFLPHSNAVQKLLSEAEMGELFKAIAFMKTSDSALETICESLPGFTGKLRPL